MADAIIEQLRNDVRSGDISAALDRLAEKLRCDRRFHDLFDARLMQARLRLGRPATESVKLEDVDEPLRGLLENSYVAACREVGGLLLAENKLREAWMYLRPVDARSEMKQALDAVQIDEENVDVVIEIALHEGVHPRRGFEGLLQHHGVCNAITAFESQMGRFPRADQQAAAAMLVQHLHDELTGGLIAEIKHREGATPAENSLAALSAAREWLFANNNYHVDTTHLAAIVRFARVCTDAKTLRAAIDLTEYGRRLAAAFQFPGDEPFVDIYPCHAMFFQAQLGENPAAALNYFRERAENVSPQEHGTLAIETYIVLLSRLGKHHLALKESVRLLGQGEPRLGLAPSLFELSRAAGDFEPYLARCLATGDLVGYASGLIAAKVAAREAIDHSSS